jgi:hypothetical protein
MEPQSAPMDSAAASEEAGTVSIELNFKAFADNVPLSQHARRAPSHGDPSVQDFADQALELAALRAELKRLAHDYEILQQQAVVREARLDALRSELTTTRLQLREALRRQPQEENSVEIATIALESAPAMPQLIPVDRPDSPVDLSRDVITIGRTPNSDFCIDSTAVSRDHARLLVASGNVTLVDASSTNGCFVNDQRVKRHRLRDGDLVRIGDRSFRFASSLTAAAAIAAPP